jgi:hypothetical protein
MSIVRIKIFFIGKHYFSNTFSSNSVLLATEKQGKKSKQVRVKLE